MKSSRSKKTRKSTQTSTSSNKIKRSGFEDKVASFLDKKKIKHGYEEVKIHYTVERKYIVDFSVGSIYIESKGRFTSADRSKHLKIKAQHPELDIRFLFQRDNKLNKSSKTRYSDWAKRHGFKYHVCPLGNLPKEWLKDIERELKHEKPKKAKPRKAKKKT
jgi:hypothetical protein